jgi:leucyl-tRNA synthetase
LLIVHQKLQIQNHKSQINPKSKIQNPKLDALVQKTIKKVGEDIEGLKLNTAVSALMILANELDKQKELSKVQYSKFLILLNPLAPHLAEELWHIAGFKGLCCRQEWPEYDSEMIKEEKINLIIQINGKVRDKIEVAPGISEAEAKEVSQKTEKVVKYLSGREIKKIIFVRDRLINFVI